MMPPFDLATTVAASPQRMATVVGERVVILDVRAGVYYGLDTVGAYVWSLLQQPLTVEELRDRLLEEFDVEPAVCTAELLALLDQLAAKGLIQVLPPTPFSHADGGQ